jgi:transcriptional regulator with XRE-family HTH domain
MVSKIVYDCLHYVKYYFAALRGAMTLAEYVTKVMDEQGLNPSDVERRTGNAISDAQVRNIMNGTTTNPRLNTLLVLAEGLGVNPVDLFKAAAGIEEEMSAYQLVVVMQNLIKSPNKLKGVKKVLKIE